MTSVALPYTTGIGYRRRRGQRNLQQDAVEIVWLKLCVPRPWEQNKPKSLLIRYAGCKMAKPSGQVKDPRERYGRSTAGNRQQAAGSRHNNNTALEFIILLYNWPGLCSVSTRTMMACEHEE